MTYISSTRLERVIGKLPRDNSWEASPRRTALETVPRDHRPVRAIMGAIMTTIATGCGLIVAGYFAMSVLDAYTHITNQLSSIF